MKTSVVAASAIIGLLLLGVGVYAYSHPRFVTMASQVGSSTDSKGQNVSQHQDGDEGNKTSVGQHSQHGDDDTKKSDHGHDGGLNLTKGQSLNFTGLTGHYTKVTNERSDDHEDGFVGNASGNFTFKVTGVSADAFNLTIASGTFKINTTAYTVTDGSLTLNEGGKSGLGNGTASEGATFTFHISGIHGNLTSNAQVGAINLDVKIGTSEYHIILGSPQSEQDDSGD